MAFTRQESRPTLRHVRHTFNVDALNAYLTCSVPSIAAPVTVKQFSFGQSKPTYILFDRNNVRYVLSQEATWIAAVEHGTRCRTRVSHPQSSGHLTRRVCRRE